MEKIPDIVMQCPKCRKEFPFDTNYCEDCTAMLEPTERVPNTSDQPKESQAEISAPPSLTGDEQIEDIRIDSLKTDIEESFIATLLFELNSLRERMAKKEAILSELQKELSDTSGPDLIQRIGQAEREVSEVLKKTAKIEAILDNLKKKLEADIERLSVQTNNTLRSGPFAFFSSAARYHRMLSSEIRVKKTLLTAIEKRSIGRTKGMLKYAFFFALCIICAGVLTYFLTMDSKKANDRHPSATSKETTARGTVQAKDIYDLLEDIRKANLDKDLQLWESRYAKSYLAAGKKKDETAEKWKKFDYISLQYRVEDIQMRPEGISAIISWDMELKSPDSGKITRTTQKLFSEFIIEDHKLKIASVRKSEQ